MPEQPGFEIPTRQKSDLLFRMTQPLGAGASIPTDPRRALGYDSIAFLAVSDQPFSISVREAGEDKVFAQTVNLASAVVAGQNQVRTRIKPCGTLMRLVVANPGLAMTSFDLAGQGIPQP